MNPWTVGIAAALLVGCADRPGEPSVPGDPSLDRRIASSARPLHVVLVMDITNSWTQANFAEARDAAVAFLDVVAPDAGPHDLVGMVVTTGRYGIEHTPMVPIRDAVGLGVRDEWAALRTASKAGIQQANGSCAVFPYDNSRYANDGTLYPANEFGLPVNTLNNSSWPQDTFGSAGLPPRAPRTAQVEAPEGGCYPNMWREYLDESGTDHTNGVEMALTMLSEQDDPFVYRAMVVITDGSPNGTGPHVQRDAAGYEDTRWRFTMGPARTTQQVIDRTQSMAARAWSRHEVNTWAVSFVDQASWMNQVAQGDGTFLHTTVSTDLTGIYEDIAGGLRD